MQVEITIPHTVLSYPRPFEEFKKQLYRAILFRTLVSEKVDTIGQELFNQLHHPLLPDDTLVQHVLWGGEITQMAENAYTSVVALREKLDGLISDYELENPDFFPAEEFVETLYPFKYLKTKTEERKSE